LDYALSSCGAKAPAGASIGSGAPRRASAAMSADKASGSPGYLQEKKTAH